MNSHAIPAVAAAFVGAVLSVTRQISPLLLEFSVDAPSTRVFSFIILGSRFAAFVLVYGLVFGAAFWVGTRRDDADAAGTLALATGAVAALAYLLGTGSILLLLESEREVLVTALWLVGSSSGVAVQLAVVTFAGIVLAHRRSATPHTP